MRARTLSVGPMRGIRCEADGCVPFVELDTVQAFMELLGQDEGELGHGSCALTRNMRIEMAFLLCGLLRYKQTTEGLDGTG